VAQDVLDCLLQCWEVVAQHLVHVCAYACHVPPRAVSLQPDSRCPSLRRQQGEEAPPARAGQRGGGAG
jgi:hypothetical protein